MRYLSLASSGKPLVLFGEKQKLRRARRSGQTTARQQKKEAVIHRRMLKALAA